MFSRISSTLANKIPSLKLISNGDRDSPRPGYDQRRGPPEKEKPVLKAVHSEPSEAATVGDENLPVLPLETMLQNSTRNALQGPLLELFAAFRNKTAPLLAKIAQQAGLKTYASRPTKNRIKKGTILNQVI